MNEEACFQPGARWSYNPTSMRGRGLVGACLAGAAAGLGAACVGPGRIPRARLAVEAIPPPPGAAPRGLAVVDAHGSAWAIWTEARAQTTAVAAARWAGDDWAPAVTLSTASVVAVPGGPPALASLEDGTLVAGWAVRSSGAGRTPNVDLVTATSKDGGATWSDPVALDRAVGGYHEPRVFFAQRPYGLSAIWLREAIDPLDRQRDTSVVMSSFENGRFGAPRPLDARVCDRGRVTLAGTAEGLIAAWRQRTSWGEDDVVAAVLHGGDWARSSGVVPDGWRPAQCPREGPIVVAKGRRAFLAWFTAAPGPRVKVAASLDGGRSFGGTFRVDAGNPVGGVGLAMLGPDAVTVWVEREGESLALRGRPVDVDGARGDPFRVAELASLEDDPTMAHDRDGLLVAWEETAGSAHFARIAPSPQEHTVGGS